MEDAFELPLGASLDQKMDLMLKVIFDLRKTLAGTVKQLELVTVRWILTRIESGILRRNSEKLSGSYKKFK
jgi:hypothetical protein